MSGHGDVEPTPFERRLIALLGRLGVYPGWVEDGTVNVAPFGRGFMLTANLGVLLDADAAAELFAVDVAPEVQP